MEEWKDIPLYEWLYQVSNLGRVKSLERFTWFVKRWEKILKPNKHKLWYVYVTLCNIKYKKYSIHRLVWLCFLWLDILDKSKLICHKNDIKDDNRVDNLFIWTAKDNTQDMISKWRRKWNRRPILQIDINWNILKRWNTSVDAYKELWISNANINVCLRWRSKTAWWFVWKYA